VERPILRKGKQVFIEGNRYPRDNSEGIAGKKSGSVRYGPAPLGGTEAIDGLGGGTTSA
jgi:hypothetical protein